MKPENKIQNVPNPYWLILSHRTTAMLVLCNVIERTTNEWFYGVLRFIFVWNKILFFGGTFFFWKKFELPLELLWQYKLRTPQLKNQTFFTLNFPYRTNYPLADSATLDLFWSYVAHM